MSFKRHPHYKLKSNWLSYQNQRFYQHWTMTCLYGDKMKQRMIDTRPYACGDATSMKENWIGRNSETAKAISLPYAIPVAAPIKSEGA